MCKRLLLLTSKSHLQCIEAFLHSTRLIRHWLRLSQLTTSINLYPYHAAWISLLYLWAVARRDARHGTACRGRLRRGRRSGSCSPTHSAVVARIHPRLHARIRRHRRHRDGADPDRLCRAAHLVERQPRDIGEISRNQRKNAGRNEREEPGKKREGQRDVLFHVIFAGGARAVECGGTLPGVLFAPA